MPSEWKTDKEKAEALNNSRPFDVHRWSDFQEVNDAVDRLHEMLNGLEDFKGKKPPSSRNRWKSCGTDTWRTRGGTRSGQ